MNFPEVAEAWADRRSAAGMLKAVDRNDLLCLVGLRKLKLLACACARIFWGEQGSQAHRNVLINAELAADQQLADTISHHLMLTQLARLPCKEEDGYINPASWPMLLASTSVSIVDAMQMACLAHEQRYNPDLSDAITDIIGVCLAPDPPGLCRKCHGSGTRRRRTPRGTRKPCRHCGASGHDRSWVTDEIMCVGRAAYQERVLTPCLLCHGSGVVYYKTSTLPCGTRFREVVSKGAFSADPKLPASTCHHCQGRKQVEMGCLDNARLNVLADACLDAGCPDAAVIAHLREDGQHFRGCWALDRVLFLR